MTPSRRFQRRTNTITLSLRKLRSRSERDDKGRVAAREPSHMLAEALPTLSPTLKSFNQHFCLAVKEVAEMKLLIMLNLITEKLIQRLLVTRRLHQLPRAEPLRATFRTDSPDREEVAEARPTQQSSQTSLLTTECPSPASNPVAESSTLRVEREATS